MEHLIIAALATWRISSLLARETGPMWIFSNFRAWIEKKSLTGNKFFISLFEGIECVWCNSVWVATIIAILMPGNYILNVLSISAGSIIIDSALGRING